MPLELNMAAAEDLRSLPGVGPVLSQRIVRFRDVLGGFHDIDNLYEVYGLDSSVVDGAKAYVTVDATLVRPVCLDTVSFRSMLKHPRFDVETTKVDACPRPGRAHLRCDFGAEPIGFGRVAQGAALPHHVF